jgi:hypothetical protein
VLIPLDKTLLMKYPRFRIPTYFAVTLAVFLQWLPVSLALYPQTGAMAVCDIEPEVAGRTEEPCLRYNKGL